MADLPRIWATTRIGLVRATNEDRCRVGGWRSEGIDTDWAGSLDKSRPWAIVADGMGGHLAGDFASETAVDELDRLMAGSNGRAELSRIINEANRGVFEAMHRSRGRPAMGTTIAGLWVEGPNLSLFNVGDSRAYLLRDSKLEMRSIDHILRKSLPSGQRSHALTQSLGGSAYSLPLLPHIESIIIRSGDTVLLCTDGLTDMLTDEIIASAMRTSPTGAAKKLADAAVSAGGRDNVTVVIVSF